MIGFYTLDQEMSADESPVYIRQDDDVNDKDVRVFRSHGLWMIADFDSWPPNTLYRCDDNLPGMEEHCRRFQPEVPLQGFAQSRPSVANPAPTLQSQPCFAEKIEL